MHVRRVTAESNVLAPAPPSIAAPEAGRRRLPSILGVGFGVAVAVGSMIGAGILRAPADVAARLPTAPLFLGVWVIGGLYALLGANAMAELGTMRPRSGGQYVFARHAFGPFVGFVVGWGDWVSSCGSVAVISLVVADAAGALVPALAPWATWTALAVVAVVTLLACAGARTGDRAQRTTSLLKGAVLLALVVACVVWAATHDRGAAAVAPAPPRGLSLLAALVVALQGVIFAYDGWVGILYFTEEVRDPAREVPRSLFGGVASTLALYLLVNVAFLAVLPLPDIASSPLAAATVAARVFGAHGAAIVNGIVLLALPSAVIANLLMGSRVAYALGRDDAAPAWLGGASAGGAPRAAIVVSAALTAAFLLTGTFERVVAVCSFLFVASYAISFAALFLLRRREPNTPRPWRARGHPWTTGLVLVGSIAFLGGTVMADVRNGILALGFVVLSYPAFRLLRRTGRGSGGRT
ncbi:MAG TPA: APC family permease [Gemmatimonadaceae bacterium]|nr:APC family permease [Gemmatimonadaceae bacterium]